MKMSRMVRAVSLWTMGLAFATPVIAEVPPRDESGQTLTVPPEQLQQGDIYYFSPGDDTQLIVSSEAPIQRITASSRRVVGYMVAPFELADADNPFIGGAARIPVASLATGWSAIDDTMLGPQFFDAAKFPEITVELQNASDAKREETDSKRGRWRLTFKGALTVKDKTIPVEFPAEINWIPFSWSTMNRFPGDLLTLRATLDLKLSDIGLTVPGREYQGRVADSLKIDLYVLANTTPPYKSLDPSISQAAYRKHLRFLTSIRDLDQPAEGYALGRALAKENWDSAAALNRMAVDVLNEPDIRTRDFSLARDWAMRASELTQYKDAAILDTLAQACFLRSDMKEAADWQRKALDAAAGMPTPFVESFKAKLARYESLATTP